MITLPGVDPAAPSDVRVDDDHQVIAGFFVIDAPDLDAALAIAGRNPAVRQGGGVEVRPLTGGFVRP